MATEKEKLNELIDYLNEKQLSEVIDFVEFLKNKTEKEFWENIPEDDEPLTDVEKQIIEEARKDFKAGKTLKFDEVFGKDEDE